MEAVGVKVVCQFSKSFLELKEPIELCGVVWQAVQVMWTI
jgi:hypothetical protein